MYKLQKYAIEYKYSNNTATTRAVVALALLEPAIDEYINIHKEGWQGTDGEFARAMCACLQALHT